MGPLGVSKFCMRKSGVRGIFTALVVCVLSIEGHLKGPLRLDVTPNFVLNLCFTHIWTCNVWKSVVSTKATK